MDDFSAALAAHEAFVHAGADVLYPVNSIEDTLDTIMSSALIDGAILAVSLQGEATFVAARHLVRRQIPFIFVVGHTTPEIPHEFNEIERIEAPVKPGALLDSMNALIQDR